MREMPKLFQLVVPLCVVLVSTQACAQSRWETNAAAGHEAYEQARYVGWTPVVRQPAKQGFPIR